MLKPLRIRWRSRSVTLPVKIMVLLGGSMLLSLGLAGLLIYDGLHIRTWSNAREALLLATASSAAGLDLRGLDQVRQPGDVARPAYRRLQQSLRELYRRGHLEREEQTSRLAVLRFSPARDQLSLVASTESAGGVGRLLPTEEALYRAVATREAAVQQEEDEQEDWLAAYAPLGAGAGGEMYLLKMERNTAALRGELVSQLGTILLGALAGLGLALAGGWLVTRQITKPLRNFVDVMRLIQATGDYGMKIDLHPEDRDMSVVEATFQALVNRVQDSREREEQSYWSTLQALVTALDVRDNESAGHSLRVTRYSLAIGERLHLRPELMEQLRQGALLHDIGKIGVPDAVLRKAGQLSGEEWLEMRKHPSIGRGFLEDIAFLRPAMAVVYCHHERWDGSGYPQALLGESIPVAARVFAVADALDAITSQRYYKPARSFREAQAEIEACAGSHFDPAVVKAFLGIPEKVFTRIRQETSLAGVEIERLRRSAA